MKPHVSGSSPRSSSPPRELEATSLRVASASTMRDPASTMRDPASTIREPSPISRESGSTMREPASPSMEVAPPPPAAPTPDVFEAPRALGLFAPIAGATVSALAIGGGATAAAARQGPLDPALFRHLRVLDRPFNQLPIIMQHNAGSEPGSGSLPLLAQSQSLSIREALERTPVRAFELDLYARAGAIVVNHGGLYDARAEPLELEAVARTIDAWLDRTRSREVIYLMLESHLGDREMAHALDTLESTFGSRLYRPEEFSEFFERFGHFPTVAQLTEASSRVLVIRDRSIPWSSITFSKGFLRFFEAHVWEDRTLIGRLGTEMHHEIPAPLHTERVDALLERGGIIKLDQITAQDARLLRPEDRHVLALRPDISALDTVYVAHDTARLLVFFAGMTLGAAAGTFAAAGALLAARAHGAAIGDARAHVRRVLEATDPLDLLPARGAEPLEPGALAETLRASIPRELALATLRAGVSGSLGASGALLSLGLLLPTAFAPLTATSLGALGLGLAATGAYAFENRRRMRAVLDDALASPEVVRAIDDKVAVVADLARRPDLEALALGTPERTREERLGRISRGLTFAALVTRISSRTKYPVVTLGRVSWLATGALLFVASTLETIVARGRRRRTLRALTTLVAERPRGAGEGPAAASGEDAVRARIARAARLAGREVFGRGALLGAQSAFLTAGAGLLFPAWTGFVLAAAAAWLGLGLVLSGVAAWHERRLFRDTLTRALDAPETDIEAQRPRAEEGDARAMTT